jgi:hypothetical protein
MKEEHRKAIENMVPELYCPKLLQCYYTGLKALCKARDIGLKSLVECLEEESNKCSFSLSLSGLHICKCPVRVYICKKLGK